MHLLYTFDVMLDMDILIKLAPASVALAIIFLVLGGPKGRIPLHNCEREEMSTNCLVLRL